MRWTIWDYVSISAGLLYGIPVILYYFTSDIIQLKALIGMVGTVAISETLKKFVIKDANPRPQGASNCNLLCNDGNQSGRPGMPSSHSAQVAFFAGFYIQQTNNWPLKIILVVYAVTVMLSRYIKRCHTINQIVVGGILGVCLSYLVVRHL
jgi:membrane-associated phospholipid phosphatase